MTPAEDTNRRMLRARDAMDRDFAGPLDVRALARIAHVSPAHFSRTFRRTFGETPHRYLQRRRIERAMALLRSTSDPVVEVAIAVGFNSHGTFSRTFRDVVGVSPSAYRRGRSPQHVPVCFQKDWLRPRGGKPSSFGAALAAAGA
ncbi:MAG TPA: AraC family transcriptional regulator [Marmoricola sp.]|nr:AraC family transcriptional regulator [Marmoricola sp.]